MNLTTLQMPQLDKILDNDNNNNKSDAWRDCAAADADDSMLALWMQLLYRMAPATGMPPEWQRSVMLAANQLAKLRNRRLGVYHISQRNHVALETKFNVLLTLQQIGA